MEIPESPRKLPILSSFLCLLLLLAPLSLAQHSGDGWTSTSAWDPRSESTIIEITSVNTHMLTCAITWQGTWVGPSGAGYPSGNLKGTFTLTVPAWPGKGAGIVAERSNHWVSNVSYQAVCAAK